MTRLGWCAVVLTAVGCFPPAQPSFPADYATSYLEVRNCRRSGDHELNQIRILADPAAAATYLSRDGGFAPGQVVLKLEYDFGDGDCSGPIKRFTVMEKLADAGAPATLDWRWQTVSPGRAVLEQDGSRCVGCHRACGQPPDGFEGTCAVP